MNMEYDALGGIVPIQGAFYCAGTRKSAPFKMAFSDTREKMVAMPARFWTGVPNVPTKKKRSMAIYTCFIQHVINSLKKTGKGAIVIPTGFITAKSGIENKILHKMVDDKIEYVDITEDEFNQRMADYEAKLTEMFAESHRLESKILAQLKSLKFNS